MNKVNPNPKVPVVNLSTADRALGKVVSLDVLEKPLSEAHSDLVGDAFFGLYKAMPTTSETPPDGREVNHAVMKYALSGEEFQRLHPQTAGNLPASMTTSTLYYQALLCDDTIKNAMDAQKAADEAQKKADEAKQDAEKAREIAQNNPTDEMAQEGVNDAETHAEVMQEKADKAAKRAQKTTDQIGNTPMSKAAFRSAANQAQKAAEDVNGFMQSWGIEPGNLEYNEAAEVVEMSDNEAARRLAEVLGRLKGIANRTLHANKRTNEGAVAKVSLTRDVTKLFTEELVLLNHKYPRYLRAVKTIDLVSKGLLGVQPLETPKKAGTFRVYVDRSGSMSGEPMRVACSLAIGIAQATRDGNDERKYSLRTFDTRLKDFVITEESSWQEHIRFAKTEAGGGTHYGQVIDDIIENLESSMNDEEGGSADALVITDGQADVLSPEQAERLKVAKEATGSKMFYVEIGGWGDFKDADDGALCKLSDIAAQFNTTKAFVDAVDGLVEDICTQLAENV